MSQATEYSEDLALRICVRLAQGEPLVKMCRDDDMPNVVTVYRWIKSNEEFRRMYELARDDQADTLASEMIEIADEDPTFIFEKAKDGSENVIARIDAAAVHYQRLRIDTRKWIAAKLKPKKYGDHQQVELSGPDGEPLATEMSKLEIAKRMILTLREAEREMEAQRESGLRSVLQLPAPAAG